MLPDKPGFTMLASGSVQEVISYGNNSTFSNIKSKFGITFFDGFRTSHEIQKIELMDYDVL